MLFSCLKYDLILCDNNSVTRIVFVYLMVAYTSHQSITPQMYFMTLIVKNFVVDCFSLPVFAVSLVSRTLSVLITDWWIWYRQPD